MRKNFSNSNKSNSPRRKWYKSAWLWGIIIGLAIVGIINNGINNRQSSVTTPAPTKTVISQLTESPEPSVEPSPKSPSALPTESAAATDSSPTKTTDSLPAISGELSAHYIDVGQADSIFIELPNDQTMLIDAGNNDDGDSVVRYIKNEGYNRIDYIVGTHPHEDHIGGMDDVINSFEVGSIYMPKVSNNTRTFEDLLEAISSNGLSVTTARAGVSILDAPGLSISLLAPNSSGYDDLNDYSAVVKLIYENSSFIFMGDAEEASEREITADVDVDVLKVGHHGSSSSTSLKFLDRVTPIYAVICVGNGNSYGHPAQRTLDRLASAGAQIYRTDTNGTVTISTNGNNYTIKTQKTAPEPVAQVIPLPTSAPDEGVSDDTVVYITKSGKKYHDFGCRYLSKSQIEISLEKAKSRGYKPCSVCNPPE